jgi:cytochrome c oxidase subunit III
MRDAATISIAAPQEAPWRLPYRGTVGMVCLIVAESAIFLIFVVAYIFYMGKEPYRANSGAGVGTADLSAQSCLLSSSFTVHFAAAALRKER